MTKINVTNIVIDNSTCSTINDMDIDMAPDVAANVAAHMASDMAAHVATTWMLTWTMMWQQVILGPFAYVPIKFLLIKKSEPILHLGH